jgi:hypothetical protein
MLPVIEMHILMYGAASIVTTASFHQLILACELVFKIALLPPQCSVKLCQLPCS